MASLTAYPPSVVPPRTTKRSNSVAHDLIVNQLRASDPNDPKKSVVNPRAAPLVALRRAPTPGGFEEPTYGSLRFPGQQREPAKWCTVPPTADVDDVIGLLHDTWLLPRPDVIISITGKAAG